MKYGHLYIPVSNRKKKDMQERFLDFSFVCAFISFIVPHKFHFLCQSKKPFGGPQLGMLYFFETSSRDTLFADGQK